MPDMATPENLLARAERAADAVRKAGADGAEAMIMAATDLSVKWRAGRQEALERSESAALGLRAFVGQQSATVTATDISDESLNELAERVVAMARIAPSDPYTGFADDALLARTVPSLDLYDEEEPTPAALLAQCREAEEVALSIPGVTNSEGAEAYFGRHTVVLLTRPPGGQGFTHAHRSTSFSLSSSVLAGTGTGMERDYDFSSARHHTDLLNAAHIGKRAGERAVARLSPRKISTCQVPIIFDPRVSRSLLSSLSSAISGAAVARGTTFLKDSLGNQILPISVTIIDDPHRPRGLGSRPFDGEGVANGKRTLVENGVLSTWLLDVRSANQLGLITTGHAARGLASPPSPAPTNLYLAPGTVSRADLLSSTGEGFYVTETFGMGVNLITGDYSQGASGFWLSGGEFAYPVSEVTIAGNLNDMFRELTHADDLEFRYAVNAPTLRIDGMTVAGG